MIIGVSGVNNNPGVGSSFTVQSKTYTTNFYNRYTTVVGSRYYGTGMLLLKVGDIPYDVDSLIRKHCSHGYPASARFLNPILQYTVSFSAILSPESRLPPDSIINTLVYSWATTLDLSYRRAATAAQEVTLPNALYTDLDVIGEVYHTRRLIGESDEHYRKRLITQTNVTIGCGTKQNCEDIVDSIIDGTGSTVTTGPPATVRITFDNDDAIRSAGIRRTLLESIIPNMLAAGITWTLYTPLIDYLLSVGFLGAVDCPYTVTSDFEKQFFRLYDLDVVMLFHKYAQYLAGALMIKQEMISYSMRNVSTATPSKQYGMDAIERKMFEKLYGVSSSHKKLGLIIPYSVNILEQKIKSISYEQDALIQRAKERRYNMSIGIA